MFSHIRIGLISLIVPRASTANTIAAFYLTCVGMTLLANSQVFAGEKLVAEPPVAAVEESTSSAADGKTSPSFSAETTEPAPIQDRADLEAFFDGAIDCQLKSKNIAGGVVAIVAQGKLVFSKGYGYADVETRAKVDPEKTLFRIGSISKLFTWTAVMQQVEEGNLNLDSDINSYITNVKVPATYPEPIKLKHLMAHTAGFDDFVIGLFSHKAEDVRALDQVLRTDMPTRVRFPGVLPSYSNYGSALAGYAVACVSGQTWEDYVEQRILNPLGMNQTLVRQPAAEKLPAELSRGYQWEGAQFRPKPFEYVPAAPAGGMSMTADDAAKFMIAHLSDGRVGDAIIMRPETAQQMREPLYRPNPKTSAVCHGFMETIWNNERLLGHGGATICFHSLMELLPERGVGVFIAFNTDTGAAANAEILKSFLDRYFPVPATPRPKSIAGFRDRAKNLAGEYQSTRYARDSKAKLGALMGTIIASVNSDDTVSLGNLFQSRRYVEIEPLVFQEQDGDSKFVFQEGVNKRIEVLLSADSPVFAAKRPEWYESIFLHGGVALGCALVFATAIFYWPVIAFSADGVYAFSPRAIDLRALFTTLVWLQSVVCIGFLISMLVVLSDPTEVVFGISPQLETILMVPQAIAVISALSLFASLISWLHGFWYFPERVHFTLVSIAGAAFTWLLHYWNLLTFGH